MTPRPGARLLVLVTGPTRSGTGDDPRLLAANQRALDEAARHVFEAGHLPVVAEWLSLPLAASAGSQRYGDPVAERVLREVPRRLIERVDAVLRLPGTSTGADRDVQIAHQRGLLVVGDVSRLPPAGDQPPA